MTTIHKLALTALSAALLNLSSSHGAIVIPGADGSDGVLNITNNTVIDLSQAVTGNWDANNSANAGKGVYDPSKWAVVFKYTNVTIAAGKTLTFKNHASRAPVVWLVSGNVTISGALSLNGQSGQGTPLLAEPGPGGFRGGMVQLDSQIFGSAGFGFGGGATGGQGNGGSFGSAGTQNPLPNYGNPSLIPLIGGSGGGGSQSWLPGGAGAGGGAILIAAGGTLEIIGSISARGGDGVMPPDVNWFQRSGSGSGGGIRLIASNLIGAGSITALGGGSSRPGGLGRIRIERIPNINSITVAPDPSVVDLNDSASALLWPPAGAPEVRIVSIGGVNAPSDPRAEFGTIGADVALPLTNSTQVVIETTNVEQTSQVTVRGTPRSNGNFTQVSATTNAVLSTSPLVIRWTATLPVNVGYSALQVKVVRP